MSLSATNDPFKGQTMANIGHDGGIANVTTKYSKIKLKFVSSDNIRKKNLVIAVELLLES